MSDVQHLDWRMFMNAAADTPATTIAALDKYFSRFVALEMKADHNGKPDIATQNCVGCGDILTGLLGGWRWSIAHGDGECGNCGWPSRGHHFIKDENGDDLVTLRHFILQVHPDFVERKKRATA